ncbi:MAG TPA: hypothetical protein V6D05_01530 [Stenomitos sp.]
MQRATRLLPIALAMAVSLAPAALAKQQGGGGGTSATQQHKMSGMQHMLPGGISMKGQMDHAYTEALNAHEAVAMGMNDMAANHLSNVDLVLSHLADQMGGGGGAQGQMMMMTPQMKSQFDAIRQDASNLRGNLGDRPTALKGTAQLVSRFVNFYDAMGAQAMGGGGGMAAKAMQSPAELVGNAGRMIAEAQASLAGRDFEAARLHVKDALNHLQMAEQSATTNQIASVQITRIRVLRTDANKLDGEIGSRGANALKLAGALVNRIGTELPAIADASMGGGAGMQPMRQQR